MKITNRYEEMTWPEAKERISTSRGVIITLGSIEQHGPHLPLGTDMYMGNYVAQRVGELTDCLVLPAIPFGQVWSAKDFPGTISLSSKALEDVLVEVSLSLYKNGAKNIIMITGHSGNLLTMKSAARKLYDEHEIKNVFFFAYPNKKKLAEKYMKSPFWNGKVMHAAEMETSMMLYTHPDLVHMDRAICDYPEVPKDLDFRNIPWTDYSKYGVFGDARLATEEKGKGYTDDMVKYISELILEFVK